MKLFETKTKAIEITLVIITMPTVVISTILVFNLLIAYIAMCSVVLEVKTHRFEL